mgnify:CR=1 FL=1
MLAAFIEAPEFQATPGLIGRFYDGALERAPETCGLDYWVGQTQAGALTEQQIANAFLQSPEFIEQHGTLTNTALVETLFETMLERIPSEQERTHWTQALETGASPGTLLLDLALSNRSTWRSIKRTCY